ncbi:MAG TPA: EAL domain-containing protein [Steroidobacteraceae bacterium]|jgi:diguanylate cyclase (GGDEF)-like protein/PAS domain S-box-containing protein|nr:EAL domain-containing protein [Steroidobacteraceae bacterium]
MPQRILLIQHDAVAATAVLDALSHSAQESFQVEWVRRCSEGLECLDGVEAILVDPYLPDSRGIATFDSLIRAAPNIPILLLVDPQHEETARLAVQCGAQDYLLKDRVDAYLLPKIIGSMIERAAYAEALFEEKERAQVTLNSIGDAVVSTDVCGRVTYLNVVAEDLTGWSRDEAAGHPLEDVFHIIDAKTREPMQNSMMLAIRDDKALALPPNCVLIRRDGVEAAIEDSTAPIHDRRGAVTGAVMVFHDVSMARAMTSKMTHLAQHDGLTDLPNRVLLNDRLREAIILSSRHQRKLSVLFLDLDRFKHINDSLGHVVGDRLLQSVARRLFACVRSSDTVGRQGGDEFVVLLWEVRRAEDAAVTAAKILETVRKPHLIDEHELHITGSIGIVTYPDDGTDVETLMKKADLAMYHAKETGRDSYQFFKPAMNARAIERQSLEDSLRYALERQELVLHYQPKINLATGGIIGAEALIRWRHPQRGLVPPGQFVTIAEDCGLIVPIGRWVLREACRQARAWQTAGLPRLCVAINVSAMELRAPGFVAGVRAVLKETGLEPRYLELELTETVLIEDSRSVADVLKELKSIGVLLALDDFGTGYSSLSRLKRFPIDALKIDQSFVRDLTTDEDDAGIVTAVIAMGKSLQMRVVAEGVETREQLEILQQHGCPQGQGFYFCRPVPAEEFGQLLKSDTVAKAVA